ncbi:MAG: ATP synthase subunit I [bacterium]|nr:ATP synthase subunit I [bacterium]
MTTNSCADQVNVEDSTDLTAGMEKGLQRQALIVLILLSLLAVFFLPLKFAAGLLAGGVISLLNFRDLKKSLERLFSALREGKHTGSAGFVGRYYFKLALILIILAALIKNGNIDIPGLLIGLFLVPGILIYTGIKLYIGSFGGKS